MSLSAPLAQDVRHSLCHRGPSETPSCSTALLNEGVVEDGTSGEVEMSGEEGKEKSPEARSSSDDFNLLPSPILQSRDENAIRELAMRLIAARCLC